MDQVGREKFSVIAAFGAGIALTATVAGIYSKIKSTDSRKKARELLASKLDILNETVEQLRKDVEEIKIASMRGSPYSMKPLDIDHLEAELDAVDIEMNQQSKSRFNHHLHRKPLRSEETRFEPINSDPYTSSDETEEFFDFNDSDNNISLEPGIIRAKDDSNGEPSGDVVDNYAAKHLNAKEELELPAQHAELPEKTEPVEHSQEDHFKEIDSCIDNPKVDIQSLYDKLCAIEKKFGCNAQIMWRKSKVCHLMGSAAEKQGNKERKKELVYEKLEYAKKALQLDENCVECHKWYAIAIGSVTDYVGTKEKIENGYEFKKHLDFALNLKPDDATLHHLLGRWASEVSNLSWLEKKLASSLFAQVPETSADEALQSLLQAYKIKPEWKQNIYYICKTLISLKRTKEATEWIEKGLACKIDDDDDQVIHDKLLNLKSKYVK